MAAPSPPTLPDAAAGTGFASGSRLDDGLLAQLHDVTLEEFREVVSLENWERLSPAERSRLEELLPYPDGEDERRESLHALLSDEPLRFGSPIENFWKLIASGALTSRAVTAREALSRKHDEQVAEHHNAMVHRLYALKNAAWTPPPPMPPMPPQSSRSNAQDVLVYSREAGGLLRKGRGGSGAVSVPSSRPSCLPLPGQQGRKSPTPTTGNKFPSASALAAARPTAPSAAPSTAAVNVANLSVSAAAAMLAPLSAATRAKSPVCVRCVAPAHSSTASTNGDDWDDEDDSVGGDFSALDEAAGGRRMCATSPLAQAAAAALAACSGAVIPPDVESVDIDDGIPSGLRFFALVRDTIASVPQSLAPAEYVRKQVQIQADASGMVSCLPRGTALPQYVRSVLLFMSTPASTHAARTQRPMSGSSASSMPSAALLEFDEHTQSYRWTASPEQCTDAALLQLETLHYERFISQHGGLVGTGGTKGLHAAPSKSQAMLTLPPGSPEQLALFQRQEAERFANPDQPYTYKLRDGSTSTVSAIGKRSIGGKAREHFLLSPERPPTATLLSLVRDAAARLPGGEGSRADVCELLKESQYVIDGVNDAQISQVASGALDRLHYEQDPCVRYDTERKLWIYLHGQRSEEDFKSSKAPQPSKRPKTTL